MVCMVCKHEYCWLCGEDATAYKHFQAGICPLFKEKKASTIGGRIKQVAKEGFKLLLRLIFGVIFFLPLAIAAIFAAFNAASGGGECGSIIVGFVAYIGGYYLLYIYPFLIWVSIGLGTIANLALIWY